MKKYKDLKQIKNIDYQKQALNMLIQVAIENGSNREVILYEKGGLKVINPRTIGLPCESYSNPRYTRGVYACMHLVDGMESAFTVVGRSSGILQIELWCNKTWKDFCEEFENL